MSQASLLERELKPNEKPNDHQGGKKLDLRSFAAIPDWIRVIPSGAMMGDFPQIRGGPQISILIGPVAILHNSGECAYDTL